MLLIKKGYKISNTIKFCKRKYDLKSNKRIRKSISQVKR